MPIITNKFEVKTNATVNSVNCIEGYLTLGNCDLGSVGCHNTNVNICRCVNVSLKKKSNDPYKVVFPLFVYVACLFSRKILCNLPQASLIIEFKRWFKCPQLQTIGKWSYFI